MCENGAVPTNDIYLRFEGTTLLSPANWVNNNADTDRVFGRIKEALAENYPKIYEMFDGLKAFKLDRINSKTLEK
jgi:hypothetical protein